MGEVLVNRNSLKATKSARKSTERTRYEKNSMRDLGPAPPSDNKTFGIETLTACLLPLPEARLSLN